MQNPYRKGLWKRERVLYSSRAGGGRTHTVSLPEDFKSSASANSATAPLDLILPE